MEEGNKLPLKRVELSLTKFNEVAIPHHLNLLRQHKANIIKYEETREYSRVRTEQTHARRVASQLRTLLGELDSLRRQVRSDDVAKFDLLTQRSRDLTLRAIMDYLDSSPMSVKDAQDTSIVSGSVGSTDSVGVVTHTEHGNEQIRLQVDEQEMQLREREAVLRGWGELQCELRALHEAWQTVQAAALAHRLQVSEVASNVEVAEVNVEDARNHLVVAERLRAGAWGVGGAAAGALLGGPVGMALGIKAGAAAAIAASAVGYFAARLLGRKRQTQLTLTNEDSDDTDKKCVDDGHTDFKDKKVR